MSSMLSIVSVLNLGVFTPKDQASDCRESATIADGCCTASEGWYLEKSQRNTVRLVGLCDAIDRRAGKNLTSWNCAP